MLDESFRTSTRYQELPTLGIRCTHLQGNLNSDCDWIARFTFFGIDRERCKAYVMAWLSQEFDAKSYSFFRKADEPTSVFYVKFDRRDR